MHIDLNRDIKIKDPPLKGSPLKVHLKKINNQEKEFFCRNIPKTETIHRRVNGREFFVQTKISKILLPRYI